MVGESLARVGVAEGASDVAAAEQHGAILADSSDIPTGIGNKERAQLPPSFLVTTTERG